MKKSYADYPQPIPGWQLDPTSSLIPLEITSEEVLQVVTEKPKQTIESPEHVPMHLLSKVPVETRMERPKLLDQNYTKYDWYPQLHTAYLLHVPGCFIGDNVIFDRERYYSFGKWWLGHTWELYKETKHVFYVPQAISVAAWGGEAFQHFIKDAIPKLASVIDLLESPEFAHIKIVSHQRNCAIGQWLWNKLGLENRVVQKPINAKEEIVIYTDMAFFPHYEPCLHSFGLYPRNTLLPIQKRLGLLDNTHRDLVVYLPRKGARSVADEDKLLASIKPIVEEKGYTIHVFQARGDFDSDLNIMKRAKVVLGPHGGAFANIVFAQPGTHVIEFIPIYKLFKHDEGAARRNYWGLSQAAGLDYWALDTERFEFDEPGMVVDTAKLVAVLQKILSDYP